MSSGALSAMRVTIVPHVTYVAVTVGHESGSSGDSAASSHPHPLRLRSITPCNRTLGNRGYGTPTHLGTRFSPLGVTGLVALQAMRFTAQGHQSDRSGRA
jgi:hypothetical protein